MFGLNKKYDIPFAIGAAALALFAYNLGKPNDPKYDPKYDPKHEFELARRNHHGGKLRKTKKYKNIRI